MFRVFLSWIFIWCVWWRLYECVCIGWCLGGVMGFFVWLCGWSDGVVVVCIVCCCVGVDIGWFVYLVVGLGRYLFLVFWFDFVY